MSPQPSGAQHVPLLPVILLAMLQEGNIINSIVFLNVCPFAFFFYKKIALLFMLILFSFRRSFDGDLPVLTWYLTR